MYMTVEPHQFDRYADLLARMFEKRTGSACEFGADGDHAKRDIHDDSSPVYLVDVDAGMTDVTSSMRLLPTMGPTVSQQLQMRDGGSAAVLRAPSIWEGSRLSLADADTPQGRRNQMARLLLACHRLGVRHGIEALTMLLDAVQIRGWVKAGAALDLIGGIDGAEVHLALVDITEPAMRTVRERLADSERYPAGEAAAVQQLLPAAPGHLLARWSGRVGFGH